MLNSIRTKIEKPLYSNIVSAFHFKSAFELSETSNSNLDQINRLQFVDQELQDVSEYYSDKEKPKHFKSVEDLINDLDSE